MADDRSVPAPIQLLRMTMGLWVSQILGASARFGIADVIASGATSSSGIAATCDADAAAMYRLLRAGVAIGLFQEGPDRTFTLTPLGECIRTGVPGSVREFVVAETAAGHWLPWGRLYDAVKRGESVAAETLGMNAWDYYAANPEEALWFAKGMGNLSALVAHDVGRVYDASDRRVIVDVGGSQGVLLAALMKQSADARGILFDRPEVIAEAGDVVGKSELGQRIELVAGDFFASVPAGGDLYLLKSILHDWPDEQCTAILRNIRSAADRNAKLLVVEMVVPDEPQPSPVALMDMNMLVMLNGRERTASEFETLLNGAGFTLARLLSTGGMFSVLEAVPMT
jgi:hypothetical protein